MTQTCSLAIILLDYVCNVELWPSVLSGVLLLPRGYGNGEGTSQLVSEPRFRELAKPTFKNTRKLVLLEN